MTTTLPALEAALRQIRAAAPKVPVMVGGAVLTAEYAAAIGADGYAPDAPQAVRLARRLTSGSGPAGCSPIRRGWTPGAGRF
jgi:5-methyltetrahydrofolate--homocysteine methyltransferase